MYVEVIVGVTFDETNFFLFKFRLKSKRQVPLESICLSISLAYNFLCPVEFD